MKRKKSDGVLACPECGSEMKRIEVTVAGAESKAISFQCPNCDHFEFEQSSSQKVLQEIREAPLKIRQSIIKLSSDRLGIYLNKDVVRCLGLKKGEEILVSVPDRRHIVLELKG